MGTDRKIILFSTEVTTHFYKAKQQIVKHLLMHRVNLNEKDKLGSTALHEGL